MDLSSLLEQAKKCQTANGAGLILSCKRWVEDGETAYAGGESLAELADRMTTCRDTRDLANQVLAQAIPEAIKQCTSDDGTVDWISVVDGIRDFYVMEDADLIDAWEDGHRNKAG